MPKNQKLHKVMVIGSGPIVIGQAAEFDYSGSQACRALKEEGIEVVLVNSNPATIMTDQHIADKVYIEPLTVGVVANILERERPDGVLATLGGQIGLNLALELGRLGVLDKLSIEVLGTSLKTIEQAEDRELFKQLMVQIGEPVMPSAIAHNVQEAQQAAVAIGYPVIVRPAYTMGGTGGGVASNGKELADIAARGFKYSPINQVLIEKSVKGWKEIEYEVIRDGYDNCVVVCSMENFDPVGIHTGDSIVVAPSQTLSDREFQMLRTSSLKIARALKIAGGCNVQFALDPHSMKYYLIEVNPRVSRSSALASKATGYPIAKVATKIALGYALDEIENAVTKKTKACFEPALDYVVVKIPRWPFDKFGTANRHLGTQMKATGEVMAIERTLEAALLKAVRSLEIGVYGLRLPEVMALSDEGLKSKLKDIDDHCLFAVAEGLRRGWSCRYIHELTAIDEFFIYKLQNIIDCEKLLQEQGLNPANLNVAKRKGFSDSEIAALTGETEQEVKAQRMEIGLKPVYKMVDTCAGEFEAATTYYYSTYEQVNDMVTGTSKRVVVLGSGPIRIGQGIEFDYCSVHSAWALQEMGYEAIIINNNPETVSTDFDTSDRLYFEPLTKEDVMHVIEQEQPEGVIVQFGGQTAINLAQPLVAEGVQILGTTLEAIDTAEDRDKFMKLLQKLKIVTPPGGIAKTTAEALDIAHHIGWPVLVRPSYVLGGRAMEVIYSPAQLIDYMEISIKASPEQPLLVDKYILGKEIEVDAICDGDVVIIPGIMEHIEKAGVHSGDSIAVYPPQTLNDAMVKRIEDCTIRIAKALGIRGLLNIQYVIDEELLYVIEVNPRSSRTIPYLSKVTGIPMVKLATQAALGISLQALGYSSGVLPPTGIVAVKAPVFSFAKLGSVDTPLGPEMKSTGEVLGVDTDYDTALYKALIASGMDVPPLGTVLATIADQDKQKALPLLQQLHALGYQIVATKGTANALQEIGIEVRTTHKVAEGVPSVVDLVTQGQIDLVINTFTKGKTAARDGFKIRRAAAEMDIPCITSLDTAQAVVQVLGQPQKLINMRVKAMHEYF